MKYSLFLTVAIFLIFISCSYLPEDQIIDNEEFNLVETSDYLLLEPHDDEVDISILFIPGGLVDPHAYISTFKPFTTELRMKVLILKVRSNLAIFNSGHANKIRKQFEENNWLIGGHSLGGVVAAMSAGKDRSDYEGLFLLGSYSITDLSDWEKPVFSFLAENDEVTRIEDVESNAINLPSGINVSSQTTLIDLGDSHGKTVYYTIEGGNHAQFGSYGAQSGDGIPTISAEDQQFDFFHAYTILMINNGFIQ